MYRHLVSSLYSALFLLLCLTPAFAATGEGETGEPTMVLLLSEGTFSDGTPSGDSTVYHCAKKPEDAMDSEGLPILWYEEPGIDKYVTNNGLVLDWQTSNNQSVTVMLYNASQLLTKVDDVYQKYGWDEFPQAMAETDWITTPGTYELRYEYPVPSTGWAYTATRTIVIEECTGSEGEEPEVEGEAPEVEGEEPEVEGEAPEVEGEEPEVEGEAPVVEGEEPEVEGEPVEGEEIVDPEEGEEIIDPEEGEEIVDPEEGEEIVDPEEGEEIVDPEEGEEIIDPEEGEKPVTEGEAPEPEDKGGCGGCKGSSGGKSGDGALLQSLQKGLADWLLLSLSVLILAAYSIHKRL
jgi:hypothetical protein